MEDRMSFHDFRINLRSGKEEKKEGPDVKKKFKKNIELATEKTEIIKVKEIYTDR